MAAALAPAAKLSRKNAANMASSREIMGCV
jgi:hypothetical protein